MRNIKVVHNSFRIEGQGFTYLIILSFKGRLPVD